MEDSVIAVLFRVLFAFMALLGILFGAEVAAKYQSDSNKYEIKYIDMPEELPIFGDTVAIKIVNDTMFIVHKGYRNGPLNPGYIKYVIRPLQ